MVEKKHSENDSSSYIPGTEKEYNKKNDANQQDRQIYGTLDKKSQKSKMTNDSSKNLGNKESTLIQNSSFTKSKQTLNIDLNKNINESEVETGQDTVLRRYHKLSQKKSEHDQKRLKDNVLTIIVIVYTILILVLGFLVYRDISKRLSNLENRVSNIEASITKKANITIDDIEIYDAQ